MATYLNIVTLDEYNYKYMQTASHESINKNLMSIIWGKNTHKQYNVTQAPSKLMDLEKL